MLLGISPKLCYGASLKQISVFYVVCCLPTVTLPYVSSPFSPAAACLPLLLPVVTKLQKRADLTTKSSSTGLARNTGHVQDGNGHSLEELLSNGQSAAFAKALRGRNESTNNDLHSHYRSDDDFQQILRKPNKASVELASLDGRGDSTRTGILVITEISVEK